jgi:hypothetical protein
MTKVDTRARIAISPPVREPYPSLKRPQYATAIRAQAMTTGTKIAAI